MDCILSVVLQLIKEVGTHWVTLFLNNIILENTVVHVSDKSDLRGIIARETGYWPSFSCCVKKNIYICVCVYIKIN